MYIIFIKDILKNRNYPEAGEALYNNLISVIETEIQIKLDMSDVNSLPSMFLNMSIGKFIDDYGFPKLKEKVVFTNIGKAQAEKIKDYILRITAKNE